MATGYRQPIDQAYQAAHVVDVLQTLSIHDSPCYKETESAYAIGENPDPFRTLVWGASMSAGHAYITGALIENGHSKLAKVWGWLSFGLKSYTVGHNYSVGVRIGSANAKC